MRLGSVVGGLQVPEGGHEDSAVPLFNHQHLSRANEIAQGSVALRSGPDKNPLRSSFGE